MRKFLTLVVCFTLLVIANNLSMGCSDDTFDDGTSHPDVDSDSDTDSDTDSDSDIDTDTDSGYDNGWDCLICK